jgi:hypothetical protein
MKAQIQAGVEILVVLVNRRYMLSDDLESDSTISPHKAKVDQALKRHGRSIFNFWHFLHDYPMLGLAHPIGRTIFRELETAPKTAMGTSIWFRSNLNRKFLISRPPPERVGEQRYNSCGQSYWYLADDPKCAVAESTYRTRTKTAWVRRCHIERLENVLDLRPWDEQDESVDEKDERYSRFVMALVFSDLLTQLPEHYFNQASRNKNKVIWKPAYLMPRFIADVARHCGFAAVLYSSVRYRRQNLVVFNSVWKPKFIGASYKVSLKKMDLIVEGKFVFNQGVRGFH